MTAERDPTAGHVFISYVHDDEEMVESLVETLQRGGADVWRDRDRLLPGVRWETAIRQAIESGTAFIACFSSNFDARERSHMYEELTIAIKELRKRPRDRTWFIPVLLDPVAVPDWDIGVGETLRELQYVELYADRESGIRSILEAIGAKGDASPSAPPVTAPPPAGRRTDFKRPVSADYLSRQDPFEGFVDAALNTAGRSSAGDEIRWSLEAGMPVPARSLFTVPSAAESWIRWCEDPANRGYRQALRFWQGPDGKEVSRSIVAQLGGDDFAYVSMGPGDGRKDAALIGHWLTLGADVTYYPYDRSMSLLQRAVRQAVRQASSRGGDRLYVKAVLADFDRPSLLKTVFAQRSSPNVIGLFGQSFVSLAEEPTLLDEVRRTMSADDLLVIEAPLDDDESPIDRSADAELSFYFGPLGSLGVPFNARMVSVRKMEGVSRFPGATTSAIQYESAELDGELYSDVTLGYVHRYAERGLLDVLAGADFSVLSTHATGNPGPSFVCVARPA
jgi:hypothetical protein